MGKGKIKDSDKRMKNIKNIGLLCLVGGLSTLAVTILTMTHELMQGNSNFVHEVVPIVVGEASACAVGWTMYNIGTVNK